MRLCWYQEIVPAAQMHCRGSIILLKTRSKLVTAGLNTRISLSPGIRGIVRKTEAI